MSAKFDKSGWDVMIEFATYIQLAFYSQET